MRLFGLTGAAIGVEMSMSDAELTKRVAMSASRLGLHLRTRAKRGRFAYFALILMPDGCSPRERLGSRANLKPLGA
jgi:hypothetical protein